MGNISRSVSDYSVYFITLAFATCLLYAFTASGDYLLALDLTEEQRGIYGSASMVTQAFSVFSVVFGLLLVGFLALILGSSAFGLTVLGVLGVTAVLLGAYYLITCRECERLLLP